MNVDRTCRVKQAHHQPYVYCGWDVSVVEVSLWHQTELLVPTPQTEVEHVSVLTATVGVHSM